MLKNFYVTLLFYTTPNSWLKSINTAETCCTIKHTVMSTVINFQSTTTKYSRFPKTFDVVFVVYWVFLNLFAGRICKVTLTYGVFLVSGFSCWAHMQFYRNSPDYHKRLGSYCLACVLSLVFQWFNNRPRTRNPAVEDYILMITSSTVRGD
jgi:hypothetical protein